MNTIKKTVTGAYLHLLGLKYYPQGDYKVKVITELGESNEVDFRIFK